MYPLKEEITAFFPDVSPITQRQEGRAMPSRKIVSKEERANSQDSAERAGVRTKKVCLSWEVSCDDTSALLPLLFQTAACMEAGSDGPLSSNLLMHVQHESEAGWAAVVTPAPLQPVTGQGQAKSTAQISPGALLPQP